MNRLRALSLGQAVGLATGLLLGLVPTMQARAQPLQWLPDRQYQEGPGFRLGDVELHPGIAMRGGYDNNVFRSDGKTRTVDNSDGSTTTLTRRKRAAGILAITPHLYLSTVGGQRAREGEDRSATPAPRMLTFRAGLSATYFHYFLEDAPHNVGADADVFLGIAEGRPVGVDISAGYSRNVPPFTENIGRPNAFVYHVVDPSVRLKLSSRSRVLTGYVGYAPRYTHYEDRAFNYLNNIVHGADAGLAWRFLPSTALIYDARFAYQNYTNNDAADLRAFVFSNNKFFRTRLGINGALTNNWALRVLAGYAAGFFNQRDLDDVEDVVGEAVVMYRFDPHALEFGYQRDVQPSALGGWVQSDRGFAKLGFLFARRFALGLEVGAGGINYGRMVKIAGGTATGLGAGNDETRKDIRVDGAVRAEYRATNWLAFMADFVAQSVITDFEYAGTIGPEGQVIPDPASYTSLAVFGGVRAHY